MGDNSLGGQHLAGLLFIEEKPAKGKRNIKNDTY